MSWHRDETGRLSRRLDFEEDSSSWSGTDSSETPLPANMNQIENNAARTLNDYLHPTRTAIPSCIIFPQNTPQMDFKPGMIQLLPNFHGLDSENPYLHIREFEEVVATFHSQPNAVDAVRLKFFHSP